MTSRARPGISKGLRAQLSRWCGPMKPARSGMRPRWQTLAASQRQRLPSGSRQHSPLEWTSRSPGGRHRCPSLRFQRARTRLLFVWATEIARRRPQHRAAKSVPWFRRLPPDAQSFPPELPNPVGEPRKRVNSRIIVPPRASSSSCDDSGGAPPSRPAPPRS